MRQDVSLIPLYKDNREQVSVFFMEPGAKLSLSVEQGIELLVIQGSVDVSDNSKNQLFQHSWMRPSAAGALEAGAGSQGAKVWIKQNHLADIDQQIERVILASS